MISQLNLNILRALWKIGLNVKLAPLLNIVKTIKQNKKHIFSCSLPQRIEVLVQEGKYQDALALALSFYENKAKAIVGLTGGMSKKKEIVADLVS